MKKRILGTVIACTLLLCGCQPETDVTVSPQTLSDSEVAQDPTRITVLINKNSRKYHLDPSCVYALRMAEENRLVIEVQNLDYLQEHGYEPCSRCNTEKVNKKQMKGRFLLCKRNFLLVKNACF